MSTAESESKLPVLNGLRAISILLVLACHLLPLGPKAMRLNEVAGAMGMSLFFALSGFLITSGLIKNPNVQDFIERRLARILPLVYAYTVVVFLVFTFSPMTLIWTNLFTVNYLWQYLDPGWSAHLWSLCVEIHFYLAIALVVLLFGQSGLWIVWPACLAVTLMRISTGTHISIVTHLRARYIATISYALYIIHPATAHGWMSEGGAVTKYLLKRPMSFALTFLIAHLSTFYWERPWQTAVKRRIQKRRQLSLAKVAGSNNLPYAEGPAR